MQLLYLSLKPSSFIRSCSIPEVKKNVKQQDYAAHTRKQQLNFLKSLAPPIMATIFTFSSVTHSPVLLAQAIDIQKGASLFSRSCIGCHAEGGNIIQPGATLFLKDLLRNGVDTKDEIYRITYSGKGRMPGFGENCTPRGQCTFGPRLQEDEIKVLAEFVKLQADQGWPNVETTGD
ncbi:hypothetical protein M9H77_17500 [Catharanthus roseus]|uniref:Uncharacterized protein n=1 Tax=Catharanthus roseus TaxID=4058 RepID=A0ACC0B4U6_CATRO|nr:hypothetical protein M9H77_17500 [Catharanthus roseus]